MYIVLCSIIYYIYIYHITHIASALITLGVRHDSTLRGVVGGGRLHSITWHGHNSHGTFFAIAADRIPPVLSWQCSFLASLSKLRLLANWLHSAFLDPQEALPLDQ